METKKSKKQKIETNGNPGEQGTSEGLSFRQTGTSKRISREKRSDFLKSRSAIKEEKVVMPETDEGTVLFNVPLPKDLKDLENLTPIIIKQPYHIDYIHSYGQDSPFFAGLANKRLLGTECEDCHTKFATPRLSCTECGSKCRWIELPQKGKVHTFTVCYFGSEAFLKETPFVLALIEFPGIDTLFLTRIVGLDPNSPDLDWVGLDVKAQFVRNSKFSPTDVYFVPAKKGAVR